MADVFKRVLNSTRGILPVFGIAVSVALLGTATGFVWDRVHKAQADDPVLRGTQAVTLSSTSQQITLDNWGVKAELPLATELPLMSSAVQSNNVVGLSSADLMKLGVECQPGNGALGTITRYPAGEYGKLVKAVPGANVVSSIGEFDFVYQFPQNACADKPAAVTIINRETAIVLEALGSLAATSK